MKLKFRQQDSENKPLTRNFPPNIPKKDLPNIDTPKYPALATSVITLFPRPAYEQNTAPAS